MQQNDRDQDEWIVGNDEDDNVATVDQDQFF